MECLAESFETMVADCATGSKSFTDSTFRSEFVSLYNNLAQNSEELICGHGVSYLDFNKFLKRTFDANDPSTTA